MLNSDGYLLPAQDGQAVVEIKRSKFLSFVAKASERQQADEFIKALRVQHPQANHVCWAYIAGPPDTTLRSMSDDGEPSGTAGMPLLKVLEHSGLGEVVLAVVRYFGGTKLGTGGLQRAYSEAACQVLQSLPTERKVNRVMLELEYDYGFEGGISRLLGRYDVTGLVCDYGQGVCARAYVACSQVQALQTELLNISAGSIIMRSSKV